MFSIVRVFGPNTSSSEMNAAKSHYQEALMTRQFGLNRQLAVPNSAVAEDNSDDGPQRGRAPERSLGIEEDRQTPWRSALLTAGHRRKMFARMSPATATVDL
ncbi:hypothetical protein A5768_26465 [Mycolicibacterium fortuitum]|nr:hypothetical protein A5768_26465 [Mycolicibacterium fortuitum]